ncbi:MAG: tetratricopeptide repeat protein [Chloroflexota bacterium]|nr:tetratricopeptide repeat protein [Chloroflexota bacterium]
MRFWDKWFPRKNHPIQVLAALDAEFNVLYDRRKYAEARAVAKQGLDLARELIGLQDAIVAKWHQHLGMGYEAVGSYDVSASLEYQQAIAIYRANAKQHESELATSLYRFSVVAKRLGKVTEAYVALEEVLAFRRTLHDASHPDVVSCQHELEALSTSNEDTRPQNEGIPNPHEVYWAGVSALAPQQHSTSTIVNEPNPEVLYLNQEVAQRFQQGQYEAALPLALRAVWIAQQHLTKGEYHPVYATSLNNLASLYYQTSDYGRAVPLYQEALDIIKRVLGETHPIYVTSLSNLGSAYQVLGDYARALPYLQGSVKVSGPSATIPLE